MPEQNRADGTNDSQADNRRKALRTASLLLTSGLQLAVAVGIMCLAGYWLDKQFGSTPWLMVIGIFFGAAAGLFQFIRTVTALDKTPEATKSKRK